MFLLFVLAINLMTIVGSLIHIAEKSNQPKSDNDKDDDDRTNIPCG
jgi:hypothetical protein